METIKNTAINTEKQISTADSDCTTPRETQRVIVTGMTKKVTLYANGNASNDARKMFLPADVLAAMNADFLSEHLCRMWILNKIHGTEAPQCPGCGEPVADNLLRTFWESRRVRCRSCGKMFTALTGTFLSGCHMTFREIFLLAVLLSFDLADRHIAQIMKMSPENVRLWRLKFNQG